MLTNVEIAEIFSMLVSQCNFMMLKFLYHVLLTTVTTPIELVQVIYLLLLWVLNEQNSVCPYTVNIAALSPFVS